MNTNRFKPIARFVPSASFREAGSAGIRKIVQVAVPGLCLLLTACGGNMEDPKIELNPHPKMHYAITVTVENAPGPFDSIDASVDYGVTDNSCVPEQPLSGARLLPTKRVNLQLRRITETTYETDMYADLFQDEDYYSKGVCRWSLAAISVSARKHKMSFITPLSGRNFRNPSVETRYFSFSSYRDSGESIRNMGNKERSAYPDPSSTFSVRVAATEMHR